MDGGLTLTLPAGRYRVITTVRLPGGGQLASRCEWDLCAGGDRTLPLRLEEGGEPTEHVLNELLERPQALDSLPVRVFFLVRGRDSPAQPTLAKVLARFPRIQVLLDDWAYDLEAVARHLGRDPDSPPLAVVCDGAGRAVYSDCGYRVGAVELLLKAAAHLASR